MFRQDCVVTNPFCVIGFDIIQSPRIAVRSLTSRSALFSLQTGLSRIKAPHLRLLCPIYSREDSLGSLDIVLNLHKMCWCACKGGQIAGLLRPRSFLNKLRNALYAVKCVSGTGAIYDSVL